MAWPCSGHCWTLIMTRTSQIQIRHTFSEWPVSLYQIVCEMFQLNCDNYFVNQFPRYHTTRHTTWHLDILLPGKINRWMNVCIIGLQWRDCISVVTWRRWTLPCVDTVCYQSKSVTFHSVHKCWCCTEILQAGSAAAIAALALQHRDNQNLFVTEGVIRFVSLSEKLQLKLALMIRESFHNSFYFLL